MRCNSARRAINAIGMAVMAAIVCHTDLAADPSDSQFATSATDSLGDPLPVGALFRFGTQRFRHPSGVDELALSPDEKTVVTIDSDDLIVWDVASGKERWRAKSRNQGIALPGAAYGIKALAFSSDNSRFYTPGGLDQIIIWNVVTGQHELLSVKRKLPVEGNNRTPKAIDVNRDGTRLALGSPQGIIVCDQKGNVVFEIANKPKVAIANDAMSRDRLLFGGHYSYSRFSPDGKMLAAVISDAPDEVQLREADTGKERRRIKLKSRLVRFAISPDSQRIVTTERDIAVRLYAIESGDQIWSYEIKPNNNAESYTSAVVFTPDAKLVAACAPIGSDFDIRLLDSTTGKEVGKLSGHTWKPWALAAAADSNLLYSSGWDGAVRRWDIGNRRQLPLPKGIRASEVITASPDGRMLAYVDDSGAIHLVDAKSGAELRTLKLAGASYSQLAFSPDSKQLASGGAIADQVHVALWDLNTDTVVRRFDWPKGRDPHSDVESLRFRPDGKQLAAAVFRQSKAYLWDLATGERIAELMHVEIYGLSFSPDGKTLATAGWDKVLRFWETSSGTIRSQLNVAEGRDEQGDHRMYTVCYAPTGGLLATAHLDGKVRIWNAADMTLQKEFTVKGRFIYGSISFSPDGSWLATGSAGGEISLWDPGTGETVFDVGRHEHYVFTVAFGADNRTLVSGGRDGVCYLWDLQPRGPKLDQDLNGLWNDLAGHGTTAYRAMWGLTLAPDRAVTFIRQKLWPVTNVMDLDRIVIGVSAEEAERRVRLARILADKDDKVELASVARRGIAVLGQLGTSDALRLLKELAERDPHGDLGKLAAAAIRPSSSAE